MAPSGPGSQPLGSTSVHLKDHKVAEDILAKMHYQQVNDDAFAEFFQGFPQCEFQTAMKSKPGKAGL